MIRFYVMMIRSDRMSLDDVPAFWREDVKKELNDQREEEK